MLGLMGALKIWINKALVFATGYQVAKPSQLLAFDGAERRKFIHEWIAHCEPKGRILDLGAGPISFSRVHYPTVTTFDQVAGPGVDVVGDVHTLSSSFPNKKFDTIVCTEIFEHTKDPLRAIEQIYEILEKGGMFIGSAPLVHELHGEEYGDYWRITPQGWELILARFHNIKVQTRGTYPQINHVFVCAIK
jgi:SAM-dependent methyltransferase